MIEKIKFIAILTILFLSLLLMTSALDAQVGKWEEQLKGDPDNQELLLNLGRYYHDAASDGDGTSLSCAEEYLSTLLNLDPDNALALVYYGSVLTMKARDASSPWDAMDYLESGFFKMDKAVILAPNEPEVRLLRGINSLHIPEEFQRLYLALEDFGAIEELISNSDQDWGNEFLLPYYFYFGEALTKNGQENEAAAKWEKICSLDPQSKFAQLAKQRLGVK
ncbi:MAG: hypothetical protein JW755_02170 [Candidatus Aminicenantes bacterium]|nr:hypothetical protein [Candidatus Aminicenantes bacterium]